MLGQFVNLRKAWQERGGWWGWYLNAHYEDIVFACNISLIYPAHNNFIGIIATSILAFLHFILASIVEIIFHFHGSHEEFHVGYCAWNVLLLPPTRKDFKGIIPSCILAFLHFILVFLAENIFHFHGIHEQFHKGYCLWNVSLFHLTQRGFISIIPS